MGTVATLSKRQHVRFESSEHAPPPTGRRGRLCSRAKGLPLRVIVWKHALRPALLPVISYLGPAFVGIITGSIVIETIFGLPGIGQLFVNGALNRDYGMVLSLTILMGILTIAFNAVVDVLYAVIDPKIRY